jgi:hypothetical protein
VDGLPRVAPWWSLRPSRGAPEIRYRDRVMRWTEIQSQPPIDTVQPRAVPSRPDRPRVIRLKPRRVCDDHPWRRGIEQYRIDQRLAADRKAYDPGESVRPPVEFFNERWTRRVRAHRSLETPQQCSTATTDMNHLDH